MCNGWNIPVGGRIHLRLRIHPLSGKPAGPPVNIEIGVAHIAEVGYDPVNVILVWVLDILIHKGKVAEGGEAWGSWINLDFLVLDGVEWEERFFRLVFKKLYISLCWAGVDRLFFMLIYKDNACLADCQIIMRKHSLYLCVFLVKFVILFVSLWA